MIIYAIGVIVTAVVIGIGVAVIMSSISFRQTTSRYRYVTTTDKNGNEITKVVDLEDKE